MIREELISAVENVLEELAADAQQPLPEGSSSGHRAPGQSGAWRL